MLLNTRTENIWGAVGLKEQRRQHGASMDPAIVQQMSNQQTTVNEQPCTQINGSKQVPFDILLPILIRQLDQDRAIELQTLFDKLKVCFSNQFHYHVMFPLFCAKNY